MNWRNLNNLILCVASAVSASLRGFNLRRVAPTSGRRFGEPPFHNTVQEHSTGQRLGNCLSIGRPGAGCPGDLEVSPPPQMGDSEVSAPVEGTH